jgi:hypothetical protein
MWVVTVTYDEDGTQQYTLTGEQVSIQLFPPPPGSKGAMCIVQAFNAARQKTGSFQAAHTYSVRRVLADG